MDVVHELTDSTYILGDALAITSQLFKLKSLEGVSRS